LALQAYAIENKKAQSAAVNFDEVYLQNDSGRYLALAIV